MIPSSFEYHRPASVSEALQLLQQYGEEAKIMSGGHSLLPSLKLRLSEPGHLIDISRISDLSYIREEGGVIAIGACSTHNAIGKSALVQEKIPMISQAALAIGDVQVRNRGTLGGSIAHADPAADWPASILASEAEIVVAGANGTRNIAAGDFFTGIFMTALEENEIITEIRIPIPPANTHSAYLKFPQPASRFALVGCAVMITRSNGSVERARVAFTGVSPSAFRDNAVEEAITGQAVNADSIKAAADKAAEGVDIMSDHYASQDYRKHLAKVYAKRALMAASN
ncbi:MAG TPA: xanthine dehydrogenase family protein subunit M [Microscillaceae bacterium]|nr:xanthine dehydrogenase family protein subunit M [Microscillaceae bacterium]